MTDVLLAPRYRVVVGPAGIVLSYNPDQERDDKGQWSPSGDMADTLLDSGRELSSEQQAAVDAFQGDGRDAIQAATDPSPLGRAVTSGQVSTETIAGGLSGAKVELVTFKDGTEGISKTVVPASFGKFDVAHQMDAEMLGARVASACGVPAPEMMKESDNTLLMTRMPGEPADTAGVPLGQLAATDHGVALGLTDLLTDNYDRHGGNVMVNNGEISGEIDMAFGFAWKDSSHDPGDSNPAPLPSGGSVFFEPFVEPGLVGWRDNPLTPADVGRVRDRLDAMQPDFAAAGREDWHAKAIERLDAIGEHATGTKDLIP